MVPDSDEARYSCARPENVERRNRDARPPFHPAEITGIIPFLRRLARLPAISALTLIGSACTLLGRLPYDPMEAPPMPEGRRIKPTVGWLTTQRTDNATMPEGTEEISIAHIDGRTLVQEVRHLTVGGHQIGDSVLLDRGSLRPWATWRWTVRGTFITHYNHRVVERIFEPPHGSRQRSVETLDVEPYSALGMDLLVSALPLQEGYQSLLPVVVDTEPRGWEWLHFDVGRTISMQERPDQPAREFYLVNCDIGHSHTRLWVTVDGRSVRRTEQLGPDNVILSVVRRMLLGLPQPVKHDE
ncbi:MAG: hypothetical protein ACREL5_13035 [Gemmatimonadales bacterium]